MSEKFFFICGMLIYFRTLERGTAIYLMGSILIASIWDRTNGHNNCSGKLNPKGHKQLHS